MSRINSGTMVVGIFAILVGLGGAYLVRQQLLAKPPEAAAPRPPRPTGIPFAAVDLEPGREVRFGDMVIHNLTPEEMRKRRLPPDTMGNGRQITGRIVKNRVAKGAPFTPDDLYPEGMGPSVAERLKPGYRAVTVPISNVGSVARFASPGSVVDVLFRTQETDELPETTVTLLEKVEVLAIDANTVPQTLPGKAGAGNALITLAVNPRQATALKVAEGRGEFTLTMRPLEDNATTVAVGLEDGVTLNELLNVQTPKPKQIEMYQGGQFSTIVFDKKNKGRSAVSPAPQMPVAADAPASGTRVRPAGAASNN